MSRRHVQGYRSFRLKESRMLVLSRQEEQWVRIDDDTLLKVVAIRGNQVSLGFLAPGTTAILRSELIGSGKAKALTGDPEASRFLVLGRKAGESIHIGEDTILYILDITSNKVKIGVKAPPTILVLRGELETDYSTAT